MNIHHTHERILITHNVLKWIVFAFGITLLSLGITMTIWVQELGVTPWDVLHLGLMKVTGLNYGIVSFIVGVKAIILSYFLGVRPKVGTLLNMVVISLLVNLFLDIKFIVSTHSLLYLLIGIFLMGVGTALYITANVGAGPRDSLMLGLHYKFGIRVGWTRTGLEVLAVTIGYLMSGPIGYGTILFSLTIGFIVDGSLVVINRAVLFWNNKMNVLNNHK